MSKVGINGFGRIGRLVLRRLLEVKSNIDVVAMALLQIVGGDKLIIPFC